MNVSYTSRILWISTICMMGSSFFRSWNLGFQYESYIISTFAQITLTLDSFVKNDMRHYVLNCFYLINGLVAIYRWS
jgi:hypothetical protein